MLKDLNAGSRLWTAEHRNLQSETLNNFSHLTFSCLKTTHYTIFNCFDKLWAQLNLYCISMLRQNSLNSEYFKEMVIFVVQQIKIVTQYTTQKAGIASSKTCYSHSPEYQPQNQKLHCEFKTNEPMFDLQGVYHIRHLMMREKRERQD